MEDLATLLLGALRAQGRVLIKLNVNGDAAWEGSFAVASSVVVSAVGLFAIGGAITLFTGAPVWRSGSRQLVLGLAAAGLTFGVGKLIGMAISS